MKHPLSAAASYLALSLFLLYVAVFPGSTLTVALDRVPAWGVWFGAALLFVQGGALLAWLAAQHGARGLAAGLLIGALAFAVEYVGVVTGWPFGRYVYTPVLQPQIAGTVPLAICFAWLMVVPCAWEVARRLVPSSYGRWPALLASASLVLLLDLQIETVAAHINGYWRWFDGGPYHGVPTQNFAAWWVVGLALSALLERLTRTQNPEPRTQNPEPRTQNKDSLTPRRIFVLRSLFFVLDPVRIPVLLYLLSTVMFTAVNLARGYTLAGLVGLAALVGAAALTARGRGGAAGRARLRRRYD